jgi:hypothetical protein
LELLTMNQIGDKPSKDNNPGQQNSDSFDPAKIIAAFEADLYIKHHPTENELSKWRERWSACPLHVPPEQDQRLRKGYDGLLGLALDYSQPGKHEEIISKASAFRMVLPIQDPPGKAKPNVLLLWVRSLLDLYSECGGLLSARRDSYCVKFIHAVATDVMEERGWELYDSTIEHLVKRCLKEVKLTASDLAAGHPDLGIPSLLTRKFTGREPPDEQEPPDGGGK